MSYSTTAKLIYGAPIVMDDGDSDYDSEIPIRLNSCGKTSLVIVTDGDLGGVAQAFIAVKAWLHEKSQDDEPLFIYAAGFDVSDDDIDSILEAIESNHPDAGALGWYLITDRG